MNDLDEAKEVYLDEVVTAICLRNGDAYDKAQIILKASEKYFQNDSVLKSDVVRAIGEDGVTVVPEPIQGVDQLWLEGRQVGIGFERNRIKKELGL